MPEAQEGRLDAPRKDVETFSTPAWPLAANPTGTARPIITARAPRASALTTSLPAPDPSVEQNLDLIATVCAIRLQGAIVAGVPSRCSRRDWNTEIRRDAGVHPPASHRRCARPPLSMNAPSHWLGQPASLPLGGGVCIHAP